MALYTVLRAFNGGGVVLQRGDIIDSEVFNMPYGRDNQLVEARYLTPSPVGSKSTIVPDASQLPESKHPKGSIKDTKISEQGAEVGDVCKLFAGGQAAAGNGLVFVRSVRALGADASYSFTSRWPDSGFGLGWRSARVCTSGFSRPIFTVYCPGAYTRGWKRPPCTRTV